MLKIVYFIENEIHLVFEYCFQNIRFKPFVTNPSFQLDRKVMKKGVTTCRICNNCY